MAHMILNETDRITDNYRPVMGKVSIIILNYKEIHTKSKTKLKLKGNFELLAAIKTYKKD